MNIGLWWMAMMTIFRVLRLKTVTRAGESDRGVVLFSLKGAK